MNSVLWWFYEEENSYGNVNDFSGDFDNILSCLFPSFILITLHPRCHNIIKISSSSSSSSHDCDSDQGAHIRLIPLTHFLLNNHSMTLPSYRHCHYQCDTILGLQTIIQGHCHLALIIIPSSSPSWSSSPLTWKSLAKQSFDSTRLCVALRATGP